MFTRFFLDERKILLLISLNALTLFVLGFPQLPPGVTRAVALVDDGITVLFVVELGVKLRAFGLGGYLQSGWNKLDLTLVLLSLPSLAAHIVDHSAVDLDFLLALRVSRAFKFFRFLRFVPGVDHLLLGVGRALRASVMILVGFFVALFMVSLVTGRVYGLVAPEHFGDPLRALYSIFKIFTVEGWFDIPDDVAERLSPAGAFFTRLFFVVLLLGGGIFGLSLVNSIFVDAMVSDNNADLEDKVDALTREVSLLREHLGRFTGPETPPSGGAPGAGRPPS
jgi:voltage-gated sodium channel